MKNRARNAAFLFFLGVAVHPAFAGADDLGTCVRFRAPEQKSVVTTPACTLGVDSSCKGIENVEIRVRYCPAGSDSLVERNIGSISSPPFLKIWDLSSIPDQLTMGIGVLIIVSFSDGDAFGLHREGIFLAHKPVSPVPAVPLSYQYAGVKEFPADTVRFAGSGAGTGSFSRIYWNEKGITFLVNVLDPLFDSSSSPKKLEQLGIEVLLDPARKRMPYPGEDIMRFVVPLSGSPYSISYQPVFNDGKTYQLKLSAVRGTFNFNIRAENHKGFSAEFTVPRYLFGKSLPQGEMGFNIIVKPAGRKMYSLIDAGSSYNHYCPLFWPSCSLLPKPVHKARWLVLLVSFIIGFLVPLLMYLLFSSLAKKKPRLILKLAHETERRTFEKIRETIDRFVLKADVTSAEIAPELAMAPRQIEKTVKKASGLSFRDYIMYLRTEIVCERLRSSFSNEASIAESCGFRSVKELERYFRRFHQMTPQDYRKIQQVTQAQ